MYPMMFIGMAIGISNAGLNGAVKETELSAVDTNIIASATTTDGASQFILDPDTFSTEQNFV